MRSYQVALAAAGCLMLLPAAQAEERAVDLPYRSGVEIEYAVTKDDTVSTIRQRMLRDDIRWVHISQLNGLTSDDTLRPGQVLRIPVTWLRYGPKYATVDAISGDVRVNGQPADRNSKFTENDRIDTEADGTVVIVLPDGTEMQIAPGSTVRIDRLRQYFDGDTIDARLRLERGQIRSDSPEFSRPGRVSDRRDIRIHTPKATAAVRGTHFRVSDGGDVSASSVLNGKVNWKASSGDTDLPKGFGASAKANGELTPPEVLLDAPKVRAPEAALATTSTEVRFDPIPGAVAYRVKVAANTAFSNDLSERIVTEPLVRLDSQRDGNHFIAVRGISANGVDGLDGIGKVTFLARPVAPGLQLPADRDSQLADGATLTWDANPQANGYRVQVSDDPDFSNLLVDTEIRQEQFEFRRDASSRKPIQGYWRVAAIDGWTTGPFSSPRQFVLETIGPRPSATEDDNGMLVQWPAVPGATYSVELTDRDDPNKKINRIDTAESSTRFDGLPAGRYQARVIARFADSGLSSRASDAAEFTVRRSWSNRYGDPVGTSDGSLQISQ